MHVFMSHEMVVTKLPPNETKTMRENQEVKEGPNKQTENFSVP